MPRSRVIFSVLTAALALGGLGAAFAQDGGGANDHGDQGDQRDEAHGETGAHTRANLTPPEQVAESDRIVTRGTQIGRRISTMLDEARREHDVMRITCLDDKLTQVNANLTSATTRVAALREAVQTQDHDRGDHEFTVMSVLNQKFRQLEQDANQCIGQDIFDTGTTHVETRIDPGTPDEDPDHPPVVTGPSIPFIPPPESGST